MHKCSSLSPGRFYSNELNALQTSSDRLTVNNNVQNKSRYLAH